MYRIATLATFATVLFLISLPSVAQVSEPVLPQAYRAVFDEETGTFEIVGNVEYGAQPPPPPAVYAGDWVVDDTLRVPQGVAIDNTTVWGAWGPVEPRLSASPISGDGTPTFDFYSSLDPDFAQVCVHAAKGSDRIIFGVRDPFVAGTESFTSESGGIPDWSFDDTGCGVGMATSYDGSTAAISNASGNTLHVFDAETGDITLTWPSSTPMFNVRLSDDGSIAYIRQFGLATVLDTNTGETLFETKVNNSTFTHHPISGDGDVFVVADPDLTVYQFDGETYQPVIQFEPPVETWRFSVSAVTLSRDGSTVGAWATGFQSNYLEGEIFFFDVESGLPLGSYPVSGSGELQGSPMAAASSDDGSVMAFASMGTENNDWPEVMVFNRSAKLIDEIDFPGSAFSVDVSADGQYVVAGAKSAHANVPSLGGRIQLLELMTVADEATPEALADVLSAPSPNPASGRSTFTIAVERGQHVAVEVFDVMGRRVQTVYEGNLAAGMSETLTLDASALPTGVYVVRATGEDFRRTQRVTVVR